MALTKVGKEGITGISNSSDATAITIDSSENVGIGCANGDITSDGNANRTYVTIQGTANRGRLNLGCTASNGADTATLGFTNGANTVASISCDSDSGSQTAGNISFATAGSTRATIDSGGSFLVGTTSASNRKMVVESTQTSSFVADIRTTDTSNYDGRVLMVGCHRNTTNGTYDHISCTIHGEADKLRIKDSGQVQNANGSYTTLSDARMKENITDASSQWDDIKAIQLRNFNMIGDDLTQLGVVAQELEASGMTGLVGESDWYDETANPNNEQRKYVKQSILYMKALGALKEAMTRIETLETQNTTQATQIADLITRVTALEDAD